MKEILIQVYGRVQGVFYRANAQKKARELGLVGWVKNNPDGSVTVCAQGAEDKLKEFTKWCERGPEKSDINGIHVEPQEPRETHRSFEIVD